MDGWLFQVNKKTVTKRLPEQWSYNSSSLINCLAYPPKMVIFWDLFKK